MVRNILAVIAGLVVGMVVNIAFVMVNLALFPMPEGTDMNDPTAFAGYVETLPATAFILVLAAHLGQSFVGGWVAARLGASRPVLLALIVGVFTLLGGIANAMQVPMPAWMYVEFPLYLVVAWAAGVLEARRRALSAPAG